MNHDIFHLASRHADWVAQRRSVVATNIANANTPGHRAADIAPFAEVLGASEAALQRTDSRHMTAQSAPQRHEPHSGEAAGAQHSGNTVDLEQEMMKAGDVTRSHLLNAAIVKAFHRMSLASVKG
jgi:flagellar basal-body rod protein FlgB